MLTRDEQFQILTEVMGRLAPELSIRRRKNRGPRSGLQENAAYRHRPANLVETPPALAQPGTRWTTPSLYTLLEKCGPLPPLSALIGLCEDGLPFFFDLSDPDPGSILIAGDAQSGKTRLLKAVLASICILNLPQEVSFSLITPELGELADIAGEEHCQGAVSPYDQAASALIIDYSSLVEQRLNGHQAGGVLVLAIDDLPSLVGHSDYETTRHLNWLLKNGPACGVWVLATIRPGPSGQVGQEIIDSFGTRLIGKIASANRAAQICGYSDPVGDSLISGGQFATLSGNEWVRFWIPAVE
jgi:hypothetical protein